MAKDTKVKSTKLVACACWMVSVFLVGNATGDETQRVRIGAVASSPRTVTVFKQLTRYLTQQGLPSDYVLYSNYDALVDALNDEQIDIAWNTPLAHGQYHVSNDCSSQTLVMRDVDFGVRSVLVVRKDAEIDAPKQLHGKRLVLGSSHSAEATVLPRHFLGKLGVEFDRVDVVSLDQQFDSQGNPCSSPRHVVAALRSGRGDAGVITESYWNRVRRDDDLESQFRVVWRSPEFNHCVFSASSNFDTDLGRQFTQLMTQMDPDNEATAEIMRLEGTRKWQRGNQEGFQSLVDALGGTTGS